MKFLLAFKSITSYNNSSCGDAIKCGRKRFILRHSKYISIYFKSNFDLLDLDDDMIDLKRLLIKTTRIKQVIPVVKLIELNAIFTSIKTIYLGVL